jgi:hypothetical protein
MRSTVSRALPARLEAGRRRFEHWRRTRERRSPIPDPLWDLAAKLSATFGIHRTAKTLRLNADSLKKHAASVGKGQAPADSSRLHRSRQEAAATFVELVPSASSCSPECIVELKHPHGTTLRIQVMGSRSSEVVTAVSKLFLSVEP